MIASGTGIDVPTLSKMEHGRVLPNERDALELAAYHGCTVDKLFDGPEIRYMADTAKSAGSAAQKDYHKITRRVGARLDDATITALQNALAMSGETVQEFIASCVRRKIKWAQKKTARLLQQSERPTPNKPITGYHEEGDLSNVD